MPSKLKRALARTLGLAVGLALGVLVLELALRWRPELLPTWYRETFVFQGVELFHPGILARTPVEGVPLPLPVGTYSGIPPADLMELGIAPPEAREDAERWPDVLIPADADGFPNPARLERAQLVLLGDSFGVGAGVERPPGLRARLAERTGLAVYDVSVAGIGPIHEEWLLREVVLAKEPRAVIWLVYAGNDITYSIEPLAYRRLGHATYAEAHADRLRPRSFLLDLWRRSRERSSPPPRTPLPGFPLRRADGSLRPIWFQPENLAQLGYPRELWETSIGWQTAREALERGIDACRSHGVVPILVYLPSKAQVYLPWVEDDPELLRRTVEAYAPEVADEPADALRERLLENRGALESLFLAFCHERGVACLSATPYLERQAQEGRLGYLATDTHWNTDGQATLVEPLLDLLREQGLLEGQRDG